MAVPMAAPEGVALASVAGDLAAVGFRFAAQLAGVLDPAGEVSFARQRVDAVAGSLK